MNDVIVETPFGVRLVGYRGTVENRNYAEKGLRLMNAMWASVKERKIAHAGENHWVYLPGDEMFTGVESNVPNADAGPLETLTVTLPRYLMAVYVGPYSGLPQVWSDLKVRIAERGEKMGPVGLEIYGHGGPDPATAKTTILIGLEPNAESRR